MKEAGEWNVTISSPLVKEDWGLSRAGAADHRATERLPVAGPEGCAVRGTARHAVET